MTTPLDTPVRRILILGFAWALLVLGFQQLVTARFEPQRPDAVLVWTADQTGQQFPSGRPYLADPFLNETVSWDSEFYLSIAIGGYDDPDVRSVKRGDATYSLNYGYFPLYPMAIRVASWPLRLLPLSRIGGATLAGVLISLLGTLVGMIALYDLARRHIGEDGAMRSVFYLLVFPSGFFLVQVYSEGLFIGLAFSSLALMERGRYLPAAILAAGAVLTRGAGPALGPALLVSVLAGEAKAGGFTWRPFPWRAGGKGVLYALVPAAAFLAWYAHSGTAFGVLEDEFYGGGAMPPRILSSLINWKGALASLWGDHSFWYLGGTGPSAVYYGIEIGAILLGLAATIAGFRRYPAVATFSLFAWALAIFSNTPQSAVRYMLVLPTIPLMLGRLGRHPLFDRAWSLASILLMGLLATLFSFDFWVA